MLRLAVDWGSDGNIQARGWNQVVPLPSRFFHNVCWVIDLMSGCPVRNFSTRLSSQGPAGTLFAATEAPATMIDLNTLRRVINLLAVLPCAVCCFAMPACVRRPVGGFLGAR